MKQGKLRCKECGTIILDGNNYKLEDITGELVESKIFDHRQECIATV